MTSLFSKLKDLVNATVRGPQQRKEAYTTVPEVAQDELPEVTEASGREKELPEVTEVPVTESVQVSIQPRASRVDQSADQADQSETLPDSGERLEKERVVDLLKDESSKDAAP